MKKFLKVVLSLLVLIALSVGFGNIAYAGTEEVNEEDWYYSTWTSSGESTVHILEYRGDDENVVVPSQLGGNDVTVIEREAFWCNDTVKSITIPGTVTEIEDWAFRDCVKLETVSIPKSVSSLGGGLFVGCESLKSVDIDSESLYYLVEDKTIFNANKTELVAVLPNINSTTYIVPGTVTTIGNGAFEYCDQFEIIIIPQGVMTIGSAAFYRCTALEQMTIPESVSEISENMFYGCTNLEKVSLPNSIAKIDSCAFYGCTSLKDINIPEYLQTIGNHAFYDCCKLRSITLPDTVTSVGKEAFMYCNGLEKLVLSKELEIINENTFYGCYRLKSVVIKEGTTGIGRGAFSACSGLQSLIVPYTVTTIGLDAFSNCSSLEALAILYPACEISKMEKWGKEVVIYGNEISTVATYASTYSLPFKKFNNTDDFEYIELADGTIEITKYTGTDTEICIAPVIDGKVVSSIGEAAFEACTSVTNVLLFENIKNIDKNAFKGCDSLTNLTAYSYEYTVYDDENTIPDTVAIKGYPNTGLQKYANAYDKNYTTLYLKYFTYDVEDDGTLYLVMSSGKFYDVDLSAIFDGYTVSNVSFYMFHGNEWVESVVIPDTVKVIEESTFSGCCNLKNVTIPESIEKIGEYAFSGCDSLKSITIPKNVKEIEPNVFIKCKSLENIYVDSENENYVSIDGIVYTKDGKRVVAYPTGNKRTTYTIPEGVETIGKCDITETETLTEIILPASVTTVEDGVFITFTKLTEIGVNSESESYISVDGVLYNKDKTKLVAYPMEKDLTTYTILPTVKEIGASVFENCLKLEKVEMQNAVTKLGTRAFYGCENIVTIVLSSEISEIEKETFSNCKLLKNITMPENVTSIEEYAFSDCQGIENIVIPETVTKIGRAAFAGCKSLKTIKFFNKSCDIYRDDSYGKYTIYEGATIYGYSNSAARTYAEKFDRTFEILTECSHKYGEGVVKKEATCTEEGSVEKTCIKCDYVTTEAIAKVAHKVVVDKGVEATCEKDGKTDGAHCSVCNTVIGEQKLIESRGHRFKEVISKATLTKNGKIIPTCTICGKKAKTKVIYSPKTVKLSKTSYRYDGKVKRPTVVVKDSKGKAINPKYYTVKYSGGCRNVGRYTVNIIFKGLYSGTKKVSFNINPKETKLSKVTAGSKRFTVRWKKQSSQTTGYQIQYSTSAKFTRGKLVTTKNNKVTSVTVRKLSANKNYHIRIRTYKSIKVNGKTVKLYSDWSSAKVVRTRK